MRFLILLIALLVSSCVQKPKKSFKEGSGDHLQPLREENKGTVSTNKNVFAKKPEQLRLICHKTSEGDFIEISVAQSSIPAHLAHGDNTGKCKVVIKPKPTPQPTPTPPPVVIVEPSPVPPPVIIVEPEPVVTPITIRKYNFCSIHRTLGPYISHDPWSYTLIPGVTSMKVFTTSSEITFGFTLSNGEFFIPRQNSFLNYIYIGNTYGSFNMNDLIEDPIPYGQSIRSIFYSFHTSSEINLYGHKVFANAFLSDTNWSSKLAQNKSWNRSSVEILFSRLRDYDDPRCDLTYSPLLLDLAGEGISLSSPQEGMSFDINGDGEEESISCPLSAKTPFLVLPKDGEVNNINQLFGNNTIGPDGQVASNGFTALAKYDLNFDGLINHEDDVFSDLRLWDNANCDNRSDQTELSPLSDAGIYEINLLYKDIYQADKYENISKQLSNAESDNGEIKIFDVWFADGEL